MSDDFVKPPRETRACPLGEDCDLTVAWMAGAKEAKDEIAALRAKLKEAVEALREIATQKKTDELVTEFDVEYADFEGGYDACIDRARAALARITGDGG